MTTDARTAVRESIARAVNDSGKPVRAIAEAMGVKRQAVYQWMGGDIPLDRLGPLADMLGQPIVIRIGQDDKATWPEWARQLDAKVDQLLSDEAIAAALREARGRGAPPAADADPPLAEIPPSGGPG